MRAQVPELVSLTYVVTTPYYPCGCLIDRLSAGKYNVAFPSKSPWLF
jgi:hypothetical protein